jgi:hypothetical protein
MIADDNSTEVQIKTAEVTPNKLLELEKRGVGVQEIAWVVAVTKNSDIYKSMPFHRKTLPVSQAAVKANPMLYKIIPEVHRTDEYEKAFNAEKERLRAAEEHDKEFAKEPETSAVSETSNGDELASNAGSEANSSEESDVSFTDSDEDPDNSSDESDASFTDSDEDPDKSSDEEEESSDEDAGKSFIEVFNEVCQTATSESFAQGFSERFLKICKEGDVHMRGSGSAKDQKDTSIVLANVECVATKALDELGVKTHTGRGLKRINRNASEYAAGSSSAVAYSSSAVAYSSSAKKRSSRHC